ncbi:MAG: DUF2281 domain-containing protein [Candidatus Sericytochromatia bacterium]|nr:DUF2281 domain-containing protein [Candidatus Tanganyikabacteria bacterium]
MSEVERLLSVFERLPEGARGEVIDFAEFLAQKSGCEGEADEQDRAWLDADLSGLGRWEPYDWGPGGPPKGRPVIWDDARGVFFVEDASDAG